VPTRTYLTTPPGREPSAATGRSASGDREHYVPGLAAPIEPRVRSRGRRTLLTLLGVALLAAVTALAIRASAVTQAEDPALGPAHDAATTVPELTTGP
jgi:hypothetical protein